MRILFVTPVIPTETDGRRPYNFIKYLGSRHQVHVVALKLPLQTIDDTVRLAKFGAHAPQTFRIGGLASLLACPLAILRGEPFRVAWCRHSKIRETIRGFLERQALDIIHFDRMRMGQYAMGLEGIPKLIDFTDSLSLYLERAAPLRTKFSERLIDAHEATVIPRYESKILEHVDLALFCSEMDAEHFRKHHPSAPVEVIENSVNTEEFKPRSRESAVAPRCIMTGNLFYFPNIDAVQYFEQEIWAKIRLRIQGMEAQIIGARPKPEVLALDGKKRITVIPDVKRMSDYLFQEDIYVCPLRIGVGVRNKLLEAMAAGMPVVTTSLGCEGLKVTSNEEVVTADNPMDFAEAVVQLVNNPDLRRTLGERAREYVQAHHGSEVIGRKIEQVYSDLISKGSSER